MSLDRFYPEYFITFVAVVNGIDTLICLSEFSLLAYRNSREFCIDVVFCDFTVFID